MSYCGFRSDGGGASDHDRVADSEAESVVVQAAP